MLGFIFAFLSTLMKSTGDVLNKKILKDSDEHVIGTGVVFCSFIAALPLLWIQGIPEIGGAFWGALFLSAVLNVVTILLQMKALKCSDLSVVSPMQAFTPLFVLLLSAILLAEVPSLLGLVGVLLVIVGSYFLQLNNGSHGFLGPIRSLFSDRGAKMMLAVAFFWGIGTIIAKVGILNSSPILWSVCNLGLIWAGLALIMISRSRQNIGQLKQRAGFICIIGIVGALATVFQSFALEVVLASYVSSIRRFSIALNVVFGYFIFREKNIKARLLGTLIMLLGILFIVFS
ncbi:MAG: DMT family transporter [Candidatus Aenigmarchaeota archaeon]|nr:DMT family transporter [Candidatus Aenigmarchaeota archaeon]